MSLTPNEIKDIASALAKALTGGSKLSGRKFDGSSFASSVDDFSDSIDDASKQVESLTKNIGKVLVESKDHVDALEKANIALTSSTRSMGDMYDEFEALSGKSIPAARKYINQHSTATKKLTTELGKTLRNQSLFSASLLESHSEVKHGTIQYISMIDEMYAASNGLSKELLQQAKVWDTKTGEIQKNLSPLDFARLNLVIGNAQTAIAESMGGVSGIDKLAELSKLSQEEFIKTTSANTEAGQQLQAGIIASVLQLEKMNQALEITGPGGNKQTVSLMTNGAVDKAKIDALQNNAGVLAQVTAALSNTFNKNKAASAQFAATAHMSNTVFAGWAKSIGKSIESVTGLNLASLKANGALATLGDTALIVGSLDMLKNGIKDTYKSMVSFNTSQIPDTFFHVQEASVKMGMSFDETVAFMQHNKRAVAIYGDNFGSLTGNLTDTFKKFGYTMQQGAEVVGPAFEAAVSSGINIKNGDALNKFVDQTMDSFKNISAIVNMTAAEYARMNAQLLGSQDIQYNLIGLSEQERIAKVKEITATRDNYIATGIQTDEANNLIRAQQAQKHESIKEQLTNVGKLALGAQMAGMSNSSVARLQLLATKGDAGRTNAEKKEYMDLQQQRTLGLARNMDAANREAQLHNNVGFLLTEQQRQQAVGLTGAIGEEAKASQTQVGAFQSGVVMSDADRRAAGEKAQGSSTLAYVEQKINQVSSLFSNSLTKTVLGATGSLLGLAIQSTITARSLGTLAGSGGIGSGIMGMGKKLSKGGGLLAISGLVGDLAGDALSASGHERAGGVISTLGTAAGMAGTGAMIGSVIPGIGTLIGGGIGGAVGAGLGLWNNWGNIRGTASPAGMSLPTVNSQVSGIPTAQEINTYTPSATTTVAGEQITQVMDPTAHDYLGTIADNMVQAVKLLQMMSEGGNKVPAELVSQRLQASGLKKLPSATSYMTGRLAT